MAIQDKFNRPNVIYKITKDIDLGGGTLTIPEGCTLDFQGGSFSNGTIEGNNTAIKASLTKIFGLDVEFSGTWNLSEAYPEWFGSIGDGVADDTLPLQKVFSSNISSKIVIKHRYLVNETIVVTNPVKIEGDNCKGYSNLLEDVKSSTIITTRDITLISALTKGCIIEGVSFKGAGYKGANALVVLTQSNNSIYNCNFSNAGVGLFLNYSGINCIAFNNFSNCSIGCKTQKGGDNNFIANYFNSNTSEEEFSKDTLTEGGIGLCLQYSGNTSIVGGKVEWNTKGIVSKGCSGIIINGVQFDKNKFGHIFFYEQTMSADTAARGISITGCRFLGTNNVNSQHIWINYWQTSTISCTGNTFAKSGNIPFDDSASSGEGDIVSPDNIFNIIENHQNAAWTYKCIIHFTGNNINYATNLATTAAYKASLIEFHVDSVDKPIVGTGGIIIKGDVYYSLSDEFKGITTNIDKINGVVRVRISGTPTESITNHEIYPGFRVAEPTTKVLYYPVPNVWANFIQVSADQNKVLVSLESGHTIDLEAILITNTSV